MVSNICERCAKRQATTTLRRVSPGKAPVTQRLCDTCLQEVGGQSRPAGGFSLFDDMFDRFYSDSPTSPSSRLGGRAPQQVERVDVTNYFSDATNQVIQDAARIAVDRGDSEADSDHLLQAVLAQDIVRQVLDQVDADPDAIRNEIEESSPSKGGAGDINEVGLAPGGKRALLQTYQEARELGSSYVGPEHILLAIAHDSDSEGARILKKFGLSHTKLRGAVVRGVEPSGDAKIRSATPNLDEYSIDLTALAEEGKIDPVIGRADEIEQTVEILSRRTKNNPALIGEPGVGKTAIVEGIAQRIVNDEVPETLSGRRLVALDLSGMVAGSKYRGEFEERLKNVIREIQENSEDLILFIDELHTIVGAGAAEGAMDASNMLKPALARGELHVIGATTLDEYRKNIEKDPALERRFRPVLIHEPTVDQTIEILLGLRDRYEAFHRVRISDEAITAAAELSDRYVADRYLPDKAIDLIDQASARVRLRSKMPIGERKVISETVKKLERELDQAVAAEEYARADELKREIEERRGDLSATPEDREEYPTVGADDIAEIVSRATGIPASRLTTEERERLINLEETLHRRVVGQDEAVGAVSEAIRRARAGLGDPDRPIGSFLFLGPTGVGKTELARTLAEAMFGDEDMIVRLDMSEFQERHTVSRLVGAPPGYVGYEEAGQLTETVRRKPYAVVLLDEIEKAHPDVFNILLQILDEGRLTDSQGRTVNFKNTVIMMTSNLGAERILAGARKKESFEELRDDLLEMLKQRLRPEFINRIDEIIVFRALTQEQVNAIARLMLDHVARRLRAQRISVEFTDEAIEHIAAAGFDPQFGARPLKRAIQRMVESDLSSRVLRGDLEPGDTVKVDYRDGGLQFDATKGADPMEKVAG